MGCNCLFICDYFLFVVIGMVDLVSAVGDDGVGEGGGNKQKCVREEGGLTNGTVGCVRRGLAVGTLLSVVFNNYYTSPCHRCE